MANIAIVVAVSEYLHQAPLPACRKDGEAINQLLRATGRFDDVLLLSDSVETDGANAKERLAEFADRHRSTQTDEVLFYFSGHGSFVGDDLFLLLRDYSDRERKQTSLQNSELDCIIRALSPSLYVKIIDACESGVSYIKSNDNIGDYLKSSSAGLKSVYFMFSSQSDEISYASADMSYFTNSIVSAVSTHKSRTIRYKDIINAVSDDFAAASRQTPFFIMQANMTEPFAELTEAVKKAALSALGPAPASATPPDFKLLPGSSPTVEDVADRIRAAASAIASREEAESALEMIASQLTDVPLSEATKQFFSESLEKRESRPTGTRAIGEWLANNEDRQFFATSNKKRESYQRRVPKTGLFNTPNISRLISGQDSDDDYRMVTAYRDVVTGYSLTTSLPYEELVIRLDPNIASLAPEECTVLPIVSRTHIRLFWSFNHFEYTDWDVALARGRTEWFSDEALLKDVSALTALTSRIKTAFGKNVDTALAARWSTTPSETKVSTSDKPNNKSAKKP